MVGNGHGHRQTWWKGATHLQRFLLQLPLRLAFGQQDRSGGRH